jgi:hypothetical protein
MLRIASESWSYKSQELRQPKTYKERKEGMKVALEFGKECYRESAEVPLSNQFAKCWIWTWQEECFGLLDKAADQSRLRIQHNKQFQN